MDDLFTRFFFALYQFHKLHMGDLVPDITKLEGMTMAALQWGKGKGRTDGFRIDRKAESEGTCSFTHLKDVGR